jgi:acetolactate synthase-1/2/3 large subunit
MLGMHGNYGPNKLTNECDVLIAVGMRFDDRVTGDLKRYAKQAKVIHIEIDKAEISKNVHAHYPVLGDAKEILKALLPLVNDNNHSDWLAEFRSCDKQEVDKVINEELNPSTETLTMGEVIKHINQKTNNNAIIVTDVGQHQMVACRYAGFTQTRSSITSGGLGTMGFCLPAAIGAKFGAPNREVIAIIGDGGVQMTIQELGTILQTKINIKIVILNNEFLGMVRQWQELFFDKRYSSTEMINPDFMLLAKAYSIECKKVDKRDQLENAVKEMMEYNGSYFMEVRVGKENNVFPMVPSGASVSEIILEKPES